jgi:RNA polymerase sigma-70 factor (ECF subfamily)
VDAPSFSTTRLQGWLARARAGDAAARDELLRACWGRLERLARAMLRRFPSVQRWADTGDVLQGALLRLLRALEALDVRSTRDFFGLAAEQMRRELLDLARHFYGPHGLGARHGGRVGPTDSAGPGLEPAAPAAAGELDRWRAFHEAVERLPAAEREVVGLTFYHGWAQAEIADLFQVDVRTVRRRWQSACLRLNEELGGELPPA